jgi:predicted nucleic acid-binding Zn ribbon protein
MNKDKLSGIARAARPELSTDEAQLLSSIRQQPSRLNAKPIGRVIRKLMAQKGYGQTEAANAISQYWAAAVGATLAEVTRPGVISRGVLAVFVENSAAAQELHFRKPQILSSLNRNLPEMQISDTLHRPRNPSRICLISTVGREVSRFK